MSRIRWGLVSTANINRRLIPAIRESARGELVAVASRTRERAAAYAAEWEIPRSFGSYEALLASDAVDAVYISLPNHLHAAVTIQALEHGKHVLCEKPFALSLEEVDRMVATAESTGNVVTEAFMYRHHPQTKLVGEMVHQGRIGEVTTVRGTFNFQLRSADNVRLAAELGGGSLWDVGVYPVSFAQFILGEPPEWVFGDQFVGESGVDTVFCGQMHYGAGRMAQIASAFRTPFHTMAEVVGTTGRIVLDRPFVGVEEGRLLLETKERGAEIIPVPEQSLYLGEVEDMHAILLDGAEPYLTLAETRNHVRTVLALYQSARSGAPVHLSG